MFAADVDPSAPWWLTGGLAVVTLALSALRAYDFFQKKRLERRQNEHKVDHAIRHDVTEEQKEARRDATTEAWDVVDRQNDIIEKQEQRIQAIEDHDRLCAEERAKDKTILRIIITWALEQRKPPPIPVDLLRQYLEPTGGSGPHSPLEGTP